jgi:hypothetical protein
MENFRDIFLKKKFPRKFFQGMRAQSPGQVGAPDEYASDNDRDENDGNNDENNEESNAENYNDEENEERVGLIRGNRSSANSDTASPRASRGSSDLAHRSSANSVVTSPRASRSLRASTQKAQVTVEAPSGTLKDLHRSNFHY